MNELTTTMASIEQIISIVTNAVSSKHTKRAYERALTDFMIWVQSKQPGVFNKATVQMYISAMRNDGISASSINQRLSAIRKLAIECADNSLMDDHTAQAIQRVEGIRVEGRKQGNWLSSEDAQRLINAPDPSTVKGKRDKAMLAILIGCGLRREEIASLELSHIQHREGRWLIMNLVGKRNKTRSIPMPSWAKASLDDWCYASGISEGYIFRPLRKGGRVQNRQITTQAVWNVVGNYSRQIGITVAPLDLRRTFARLARKGGADLDQIQFSLGHSSVQTTQGYIGNDQDLNKAPCDVLGLQL